MNKNKNQSFEKLKGELTQKIERDERSNLTGQTVVNKLVKEYEIKVDKNALNQFKTKDWRSNSEIFKSILLTIENKNIDQLSFIEFLNLLGKCELV